MDIKIDGLKVDLPSGRIVHIWPAPFIIGQELFMIVNKELENFEFAESTTVNLGMRLLSSKAVDECIWKCLMHCTYGIDMQKITDKSFFDPLDRRADYVDIAREVLGYNLSPFSKSVGFVCKNIFQENTNTLQSKLTPPKPEPSPTA